MREESREKERKTKENEKGLPVIILDTCVYHVQSREDRSSVAIAIHGKMDELIIVNTEGEGVVTTGHRMNSHKNGRNNTICVSSFYLCIFLHICIPHKLVPRILNIVLSCPAELTSFQDTVFQSFFFSFEDYRLAVTGGAPHFLNRALNLFLLKFGPSGLQPLGIIS